jgi:heat-inducible transcriptional repressor
LLVPLDEGTDQAGLDEIARRLNERLAGLVAADMASVVRALPLDDDLDRLGARIAERIERAMVEFDATAVDDVFSEGLLNVMAAPEFAETEKVRRVFALLEDRVYFGDLVHEVTDSGDVRIYIGAENRPVEMHDVALVLAPYGRRGSASGVVGVLGPTRMAYPHAISTVRYVSALMNELVDHLYH